MFFTDLISISQWWIMIFIIGIIFIPIASLIFSNFFDKGYIFAKIIGIASVGYFIFILGFFRILPFSQSSIIATLVIFALLNIFLVFKNPNVLTCLKNTFRIFILEEGIFLIILIFWSYAHANQPDIHGLEKYMDYGFINSILKTKYFPPLDMWFTPYFINYYYFGHLVTAVLTKLSSLSSTVTFNLMLSTIGAFGFVSAFSITTNLLREMSNKITLKISIAGGILGAFLLNFAGNLQSIYLFFKPYENENLAPFLQVTFSPLTFPNSYWYPNATRFIHNTIHEFPIYSNVVSDLHGHFLDIPFVMLTLAILLALFLKTKSGIKNLKLEILLISFMLSIMYMTNAWDGIIYFILAMLIIIYIKLKPIFSSGHRQSIKHYVLKLLSNKKTILDVVCYVILLGLGLFLFSLPFNLNFKPFASGIGVLCAPKFLTDIKNFGPLLFEANHCQRSPFWQLMILYGFFYFWIVSFIVFIRSKRKIRNFSFSYGDIFIVILILLSTILIIIPEFIYVKDIYPDHYRANTMFKLVYQAFMLLSIASAFIIVRLFLDYKFLALNRWYWKFTYWTLGLSMTIIVFLYPYFAITSYFGDLKNYKGLDGTTYIKSLYPNDYEAILWINKNIQDQPVILEAQGDSYTDYARISTNTGLPTILGWTVHEWLWRGTYDIPSPRIQEISNMYESSDIKETKTLLNKYKVSLVFIGNLEKEKYLKINEKKFQFLGKIIYQRGDTKIFRIN
jgi:YYY domain-containing protein